MWIFVKQTGRVELVFNPDHIARLLAEGGHEVPSPVEVDQEHSSSLEKPDTDITDTHQMREPIQLSKKRVRRVSN